MSEAYDLSLMFGRSIYLGLGVLIGVVGTLTVQMGRKLYRGDK